MLFEEIDFATINLLEIRDEFFLDRRNIVKTTAYLLEAAYPNEKFIDICKKLLSHNIMNKQEANEMLRLNEITRTTWRMNTQYIFDYSESPIETVFLNAFNLYCLTSCSPQLVFSKPYKSLSEGLRAYRENYEYTLALWQSFRSLSGFPERWHFIETIERMDISEEKKAYYKYNILIKSFLYDKFHVSIQSTIDDILIKGRTIRPDIFIWIPAKPQIKLIVEFDGFKYHSNRKSFTSDRERDRILQEKGFQVLRFSGDEINDNCISKAKELRDFLLNKEIDLFSKD